MKRTKNNINIYLFFFILFACNIIFAQYTPYYKNYTLSEYKASNQNWDIGKSDNGMLFVANNSGLLGFDGLNWNLWKMPNKTIIRSLLVYKDKIYVGSYEEFGYFSKNDKGDYVYHSLVNFLDKHTIHKDEEFWQISLLNDSIVFRSFWSVRILKNKKITSYNLPSVIMSCSVINKKLYVSTLNKGIFVLQNNKLKLFSNQNILENVKIVSLAKKNPNQIFVCTALKGLFLLQNKKVIAWKSPINAIIKKYQLNKFQKLPNGNMVFGTIKNGVYITDKEGNILFNLNKKLGLINNTVLGQYISKKNELWLGLDNGIAFIDLNKSNFYYKDITGKLGAVYDVVNFKNTIYIGSNTGLYFIDKKGELHFIDGSEGQVWYLKKINGELFCGHNNGTYIIKNKKVKLISKYVGGWVIKKVPEENNTYIQGSYVGLESFKKNNGKWQVNHIGKNTIPIRYLVFENKYTAWVAHSSRGVYRVKFNKKHDSIIEFKDYKKKGLWSDYFIKIYKIKNTIAFHTIKGWQKYEPLLDSIVPYKLLNNNLNKNSYIISEDNIPTLIIKNDQSIALNLFSEDSKKYIIPDMYFKNRIIPDNENISKINDSILALNLYDGFMLIHSSDIIKSAKVVKPAISRILINNKPINLKSKNITIPFGNNNITINIASQLSSNNSFEYKLSNSNYNNMRWIESKNGRLKFSNLSNGLYSLLIRSKNSQLKKSSILPIKFTVLSPWYKNTTGFIIYSLILILGILVTYLLYKEKIKKEHILLKIKYSENQKKLLKERSIENEKIIIKLKNETLNNEIKLKSKQLANSAMALIKKNETLLHIKERLIMHKANFSNQYFFKNLIKQINLSIEHHDEWKLFEYNFNQVHEEFFNQLTTKFPGLTKKDLKICAYLKMNLSTKEISTLFNISIRGVETLRYRLKKKLNLEKKDSLKDFLQKFN